MEINYTIKPKEIAFTIEIIGLTNIKSKFAELVLTIDYDKEDLSPQKKFRWIKNKLLEQAKPLWPEQNLTINNILIRHTLIL